MAAIVGEYFTGGEALPLAMLYPSSALTAAGNGLGVSSNKREVFPRTLWGDVTVTMEEVSLFKTLGVKSIESKEPKFKTNDIGCKYWILSVGIGKRHDIKVTEICTWSQLVKMCIWFSNWENDPCTDHLSPWRIYLNSVKMEEERMEEERMEEAYLIDGRQQYYY